QAAGHHRHRTSTAGNPTAQMQLPDIVKETGLGLILGAIGGSSYYFINGLCSSPEGRRLAGGAQAVVTNAPRIGYWVALFGLQAAIGCGMEHVNKKDDPLNTVISWARAHTVVSMRQGPRAAALAGLKGAAVGGLAEMAAYGLDI
uniref:Mitochondrial import inner membrane translocase subunit TIM22 n=1 Tax=Aegilops tauschii subsp. strangulata TaxID=200361 RepID=A0A452XCL3_AEGTS